MENREQKSPLLMVIKSDGNIQWELQLPWGKMGSFPEEVSFQESKVSIQLCQKLLRSCSRIEQILVNISLRITIIDDTYLIHVLISA